MAAKIHYKNLTTFMANSVGTKLFRNHFKKTRNGEVVDLTEDGQMSCAFYASNILLLAQLLPKTHHMIKNTIEEMRKFGWYEVSEPKRGAVIIWEANEEVTTQHIGFCLNKKKGLSNLSSSGCPREHHITFGELKRKPVRKIEMIFWHDLLGRY